MFSHKMLAAEANHATVPVCMLCGPHSAKNPGEKMPESQAFLAWCAIGMNRAPPFNVVSRF